MKVFSRMQKPRKVIVIVNGYPLSGKDTFTDLAGELFANFGWGAYAMSSIDFIKKITKDAGISEEPKTPEKRALWAELKAAFEKYDRFSSRQTMQRMEHQMFQSPREKQIGFIHVREPEAIAFMKTIAPCEFVTVLVDRPDAERVMSNAADRDVENYPYDYVINNKFDLAALKSTTQNFVQEIIANNGERQ
ncbi:hypothetical protein [Rhizobium azibense]|uniref:Uncharacterized protein n=1 Tax=Rhizobium azibense TaxID=1136135 RepID=A0A4R3RI49_9HYPH|nr:hypothetical protein [Rhizobium azibense]TCU34049.1 hypothetical protein EV129_11332 [Rhizobium azibense]